MLCLTALYPLGMFVKVIPQILVFHFNPELHQFVMSVCNVIFCLDSMYSDSALPTVHWFSPNTTVPCANCSTQKPSLSYKHNEIFVGVY
jgi:hypothetical protein